MATLLTMLRDAGVELSKLPSVTADGLPATATGNTAINEAQMDPDEV